MCVGGVGCEDMRIDSGGEILDLAGVFNLPGDPPKQVFFNMFVIPQNMKICQFSSS